MYKLLRFCQQGLFGNFVYLVSTNSIADLPDMHTHFQSIMYMRLTSAKIVEIRDENVIQHY